MKQFCIDIIVMVFDLTSLSLWCHIVFSLWLMRRILRQNHLLFFLPPGFFKIFIIFSTLFVFILAFIPIESLFLKCFLLYLPVFPAFFLPYFFYFRWKDQFYVQCEFFINTVIAQMKTGSGFRQAFKSAGFCLPNSSFQNHFIEILESIALLKNFRKEFQFSPIQQILEELRQADKSPRSLDHLENLRHQMRVRSHFIRKMKSALLQFRVQSFVLCLLYVLLFIFVLHRHGLEHPKILFLSLCLFVLGLFFLVRCGRRIKWNI